MEDNEALSSQSSQPEEKVADTPAVESEIAPEHDAATAASGTDSATTLPNNESASLEDAITAAVEASSALLGGTKSGEVPDVAASPKPPPPAAMTHSMVIDTPAAPSTVTQDVNTTRKLAPTDRDVILGEGSAGHTMNLLLQDMIRLHRVLWKLHDMPAPTKREEVQDMANHIIDLIQMGKSFELAGLKDVPRQFMKSTGRFFGPKNATDGVEWEVLPDDVVKETMCDIILEDFKVDDLGPLTETPYKNLKEWLSNKKNQDNSTNVTVMPEGRDAILFPCANFLGEKMYEHQAGNKTIFHLASQWVSSYTNTPEKRVDAALYIMKGLDDAEVYGSGEKDTATTTSKTRYLIRTQREDQSVCWEIMDAASAAEFTLIFTFEVFLEKEIHVLTPSQITAGGEGTTTLSGTVTETSQMIEDYKAEQEAEVPADSIGPITDPTEHDVLFGRGGMTNSHGGNRRFRDIIALHRPDYIRAVKMDKPAVARKIVRAIRYGNPPGRFLKKHDDNMWYDVGDRTAAEKTSQGLRERTNAEKRQRSALREALRIRKQDMVEDDDERSNKKAKVGVSAAEIAAAVAPTLNYIGTNLPVPLSLSMKEPVTVPRKKVAEMTNTSDASGKHVSEEFNTEGLPPNAVDEDGNILVTDYDILCGRGGLTNHHKGNKRFRDVVALHRPDYVRAPKIQKPSVARVIVRAIRNGDPPGRFLRKDEKTGKWVDVGDKKAAEKTSQALREKTTEERDKLKGGEAPPQGILVPGVTNAYLMPDFSPAWAAATAVEPSSVVAVTTDTTAAVIASEIHTKEEEATKPTEDVEEKEEAVDGPGDVASAPSQDEKKSEKEDPKADDENQSSEDVVN